MTENTHATIGMIMAIITAFALGFTLGAYFHRRWGK